jgi:hypothetical protein
MRSSIISLVFPRGSTAVPLVSVRQSPAFALVLTLAQGQVLWPAMKATCFAEACEEKNRLFGDPERLFKTHSQPFQERRAACRKAPDYRVREGRPSGPAKTTGECEIPPTDARTDNVRLRAAWRWNHRRKVMKSKLAILAFGALVLMVNGAYAQHRTSGQTSVGLSRTFGQAYGYAPREAPQYQSSGGIYKSYSRGMQSYPYIFDSNPDR